MLVMPYYCEKCKRGSMKGKKVKIVKLGNKTLPSGITIE